MKRVNKIAYTTSLIVIGLILFLMFLPLHFNIFKGGNIRNKLKEYYNSSYPNITSYYYKNIKGYDLVVSCYSNGLDFDPVKSFGLNTELTGLNYVKDVVLKLSSIPYTEGQNNPNSYNDGLDCQGYSLLVSRILNVKGIHNKIIYTSNHMYVDVEIGGSTYIVDLAKHKFNKL